MSVRVYFLLLHIGENNLLKKKGKGKKTSIKIVANVIK